MNTFEFNEAGWHFWLANVLLFYETILHLENLCCAARVERVHMATDQTVCGIFEIMEEPTTVCVILPYTFMIYMTNVYTAVRWNNDVTCACMISQRSHEAEETVYGTLLPYIKIYKMYTVSDCANGNRLQNWCCDVACGFCFCWMLDFVGSPTVTSD